MNKFLSLFILTFFISGVVIAQNAAKLPAQDYIPPKVEDTPEFKKLKAMVEADGFPYSHYETGAGLIVWGKKSNGSSRGWGDKNQGIKRIPGGNQSKAYFVTWAQYFKAFSQIHKECFDDPNINRIKEIIDQIVMDTDYDYPSLFKAPDGAMWIFHPDVKYKAVCDGYSNLVIEKVSKLPGVSKVLKISSTIGNHAWNEIHLTDGRIIYCDATWYDTNGYSKDPVTGNYIIEHEPHYMPTMLTFDKDLFSLGGTHYGWKDAK